LGSELLSRRLDVDRDDVCQRRLIADSPMRRLLSITGLLMATLVLLLLPTPAQTARMAQSGASLGNAVMPVGTPRPLVVVRALGPVQHDRLRSACRSLLKAYPVRCEVRDGRDLLSVWSAFDADRNQLDARKALDVLFRDRDPEALIELDITGGDIFEIEKPYVFGLASLTERIALVSLSRIDDDGRHKLEKRLHKLVLHEVGHTFGLRHHDDHDCVMRQDPTVASLDKAPGKPCEDCHAKVVEQAQRLVRPGQPGLDRTRGWLARGEHDEARLALADLLHSGEFDHELLRSYATAFFEAKLYNEAISVLRFVVKQDSEAAEAHVDLGLCYQMRNREGDIERAIEHLERALELRPDWQLVGEHLDQLIARGP
jgi:predicted Zn-dependent protease